VPERVAVVGAGLAGCLLATLLARRGLTVDVYERRDDPRRAGAERGRSINLAISARGLDALGRVGLDERTLDDALPMRGRTLHSPTGALAFQSYSADGNRAINSISRAGLNHALLDRAEETEGVRLHFGRRLLGVDAETGELTFDGHTARADVVLGADGAYSAVRRSIQHGMDLHQDFLPHGYKELTIPARDGEFALDPASLHIWPRGASMMIALPNTDRSFTCTLFWDKTEFAALDTPERVLAAFREHYPDAVQTSLDNGIVVLYQRCTHLGCRVPFCNSSQWFECPCHDAKFDRVGEYRQGPAPRGMDLVAASLDGGRLIIDTNKIVHGMPPGTNTTHQEPSGPFCV